MKSDKILVCDFIKFLGFPLSKSYACQSPFVSFLLCILLNLSTQNILTFPQNKIIYFLKFNMYVYNDVLNRYEI